MPALILSILNIAAGIVFGVVGVVAGVVIGVVFAIAVYVRIGLYLWRGK